MSFIAPLFLLGALAIGLPIVFHLIRRSTRERTTFSSLMFLQPSPPRLTRRSRLEHILLLLLRCGVLVLLALAFARPFFKKALPLDPARGAPRRIVVLVDTSASMRRSDLWPNACSKAEAILRKTSPMDQLALFTFDRDVRPVISFEQWRTLPESERVGVALGQLKSRSPGWAATHLGSALQSAAETLADAEAKNPGRREIVTISDFQEASRIESLQGYEWPKGIEVSLEPVSARHRSNAGLEWVAGEDDLGAKSIPAMRVRVHNASESKLDQFKVGWAQRDGAFTEKPIELYVPPGQSRTVALPLVSGSNADRILLQGDEEGFDNTLFAIPQAQAQTTIFCFTKDSENDVHSSLFFLQHAFQETSRQKVQLTTRKPDAPLFENELHAASLFVVSATLPETQVDALRVQTAGGKTVLVSLQNESMAPLLARLAGVERVPLEEAHPANYAMLAQIDFQHPLFATFADARFNDFTQIHFWKYRKLDPGQIPGCRVLARFDNGDPAFIEAPIGKGRILIFTSGWQPGDSQLALSSKFVPLLYAILEQSGGAPALPGQYHIGDAVSLASLSGADPGTWLVQFPDGTSTNVSSAQTNFVQTTLPGIYSVTHSQSVTKFAVNLDPAETHTSALPPEELERLGIPLAQSARDTFVPDARQVRLHNAELENRQKLWRVLVVAALLVVLLETWLAGRATRRSVQPEAVS